MSECIQCGLCCKKAGRNMWRESPIDDVLLNALRKHKKSDDAICLFLGIEKPHGKAVCILQVAYGTEGKPIDCVGYPDAQNKGICERNRIK